MDRYRIRLAVAYALPYPIDDINSLSASATTATIAMNTMQVIREQTVMAPNRSAAKMHFIKWIRQENRGLAWMKEFNKHPFKYLEVRKCGHSF